MKLSESKTILSVVVGSRLHGLAKETSDWDIRGIFMHPLVDIISPFRNPKNVSWVEGDEDNTAYELRDFCKYATKGNPTILEILFSNMVRETSPLGDELRANTIKFLDSKAIFDAHKGYAHNQYNKMNLFEPDKRTPKFAVAYLRSMQQGIDLLTTGKISPQVRKDKKFILKVKHEFDPSLVPALGKRFSKLQTELADAYYANQSKFTPDYDWIEDFLMRAYGG